MHGLFVAHVVFRRKRIVAELGKEVDTFTDTVELQTDHPDPTTLRTRTCIDNQ